MRKFPIWRFSRVKNSQYEGYRTHSQWGKKNRWTKNSSTKIQHVVYNHLEQHMKPNDMDTLDVESGYRTDKNIFNQFWKTETVSHLCHVFLPLLRHNVRDGKVNTIGFRLARNLITNDDCGNRRLGRVKVTAFISRHTLRIVKTIVSILGLRILILGLRILILGLRIAILWLRILIFGLRLLILGLRILILGVRISILGLRTLNLETENINFETKNINFETKNTFVLVWELCLTVLTIPRNPARPWDRPKPS